MSVEGEDGTPLPGVEAVIDRLEDLLRNLPPEVRDGDVVYGVAVVMMRLCRACEVSVEEVFENIRVGGAS